jgi:hypothetical protein
MSVELSRSARLPWLALTVGLVLLRPAAAGPPGGGEPAYVDEVRDEIVDETKPKLERLRGVKFRSDVTVSGMTEGEYRSWVEAELDRDVLAARDRQAQRALVRLGVIPTGCDIRQAFLAVNGGNGLDVFDPERRTLFVLKLPAPREVVENIHLHELEHALQDERFGLSGLIKTARARGSDDAVWAFKALIEGESQYLVELKDGREKLHMDDAAANRLIEQRASLPRRQLEDIERTWLSAMPKDTPARAVMLASLEQRAKLPCYIWRLVCDPYLRGPGLIARAIRTGGWKAVDALFADPPRSMIQALRPEEHLFGSKRTDPADLSIPDVSSTTTGKKAFDTSLGELGIGAWLNDHGGDERADLSLETRGDTLRAFLDGSNLSLIWRTRWATPDAARSFGEAYAGFLEKETKGEKGIMRQAPAGATWLAWGNGERVSAVGRAGTDVIVALDVPPAMVDALAAGLVAGEAPVTGK